MSPKKSTAGRPDSRGKLAPGLRLPRAEVVASQRERLLTAVVDLAGERGYQATSVTDLLKRAAVSRGSFYELFANKEDCLLYAYETQLVRAEAAVISAYRNPKLGSVDALSAGIQSLLDMASAWPAAAQLCTSEIATAGPRANELRDRSAAAAGSALAYALRRVHSRQPNPTVTRGIVAGIERLIHIHSLEPAQRAPTDIVGDLVSWILTYDRSPRSSRARKHYPASPPIRLSANASSGADGADEEQRERIISAVLAVVSVKGYNAMTHRDIAAESKTSLTTFYKHFASKQDAFLATFDVCAEQIANATANATRPTGGRPEAVRNDIAALVELLCDHPAVARVLLTEIYETGRPGIERIDRLLRRYTSCTRTHGGQSRPSTFICEAITGAIFGIMRHHAMAGDLEELATQLPQLTYLALAPLVGSERALTISTG